MVCLSTSQGLKIESVPLSVKMWSIPDLPIHE